MSFGIIYKVTNKINGKIYIGQTVKSLAKRKAGHFYAAQSGEYNGSIFLKAINKYSKHSFLWEEMCKCFSREELDTMENFYIDFYQSMELTKGYNLIHGRGRSGYTLSENSRKKISIKAIERLSNPKSNPTYGKSVHNICGNKISKKLKDYYKNNPGTFTGKKHSEESKNKMSNSRSGDNNHFYGKNLTEEHRQKISNALSDRCFSEEHKKNISDALKGKYVGAENCSAKKYVITTSSGDEIIVHGLSEFCRCNILNQAHMSSCATGKRKTHKGYTCRYYDDELNSCIEEEEKA